MTTIDALPYPISIERDVTPLVGAFVKRRSTRAVVLADRNVAAKAERIARAIGKRTPVLTFALGERRKTMHSLATVLEALAGAKVDRDTLLVGVGGGVAGDLFGFAAATYARGVAFANVATSLVAMVDAAVGGKTGVDLAAGKNLAGAFRDPAAVFCDVGSLATLPPRHLREGLAELVKHGIIEGGETFDSLEVLAPHPLEKWPWENVVADSLRIKAMFVSEDRLEAGSREILNLGHTFGHAIERVTNYRTSHGDAVSIGLRAAGLLALRTDRFSREEHLRVLSLLTLLRLPLVAPPCDPAALAAAMTVDKKARGGRPRFVLPRTIGDVEYGVDASPRQVRAVLGRVGQAPGDAEFR